MTEDEKGTLRADIATHMQSTQPGPEALPLPPATPPGLSPEQQETLFDNWCSDIYARSPKSWTPSEREAIRVATIRALRTL
jgi:hypothetical protein